MSTKIVAFIVTIVLARILTPDDYGLVAIVTVFTAVAMVFIDTGFSSSIVQKKELSDVDKDTMFYSGVILAFILYAILHLSSKPIAEFYGKMELGPLLQAQGAMVVIAALYSVHQALVVRELLFRKSFIMGLSGVIVQGIVGVSLAYAGFGPWALVASTLSNGAACCIVMWALVRWHPSLRFSFASLKTMFSFSFKMLLVSLVDTVFNNIRDFVIGKQYSSESLAFYQRGFTFPSTVMTAIDGSMTTVLFSTLAKYQSNWDEGLGVLRRALRASIFVCAPLMATLFVTAEPLVLILLTDKWLPCVEYLQLATVICLFWPLSARTHALNALGKSGVTLALKLVGHSMGLVALILTFQLSIRAMMMGAICASMVNLCISMAICSKQLGYRVVEQLRDVLPPIALAVLSGGVAYLIHLLGLGSAATLAMQVSVIATVYIGGTKVFKLDSWPFLVKTFKSMVSR